MRRRAGTARATALVAIAFAALAPTGARAAGSAYVASNGGGTVAQFDIDPTGALIAKTPATVAAGPTPDSVGITPAGDHVYVTNSTSTPALEFVSQYDVASSGGLQPKSPATVPAGGNAIEIAVAPDGRHVYVGSNLGAEGLKIFIYDIDSSGALVPKTPAFISVNSGANGLAISPDGSSLYATGTGGVAQFDVNADGTLSPKAPATVPAGSIPAEPVIAPDGTSLYVSNLNSSNVSQFDVGADGKLTAKNPAAVSASGTPIDLAISPDGRNVYVANINNGTVSQFDVGAGGQLAAKTPPSVVAGANAERVEVSPDSRSAYVASAGNVAQYDVNPDGTLAPKTPATVPAGAGARGIAVTPDQGPRAAFTAQAAPAGVPVAFDGSGSTDPDGSVAAYDWDFGDGAKATNAGPAPTHAYAKPGTYAVTLTVTDGIGCSTRLVFTGQVASCNGGPPAQTTAAVVIPRPLAIAALSALKVSPRAFPVAERGGSIARKRKRRTGTKVTYRDSQAATTTFTVQKRRRGVKRRGKCVAPLKRKGKTKKRRCTRFTSVGSFKRTDRAGQNSFRFTGRVRGRKLQPGRYQLRAVPRFGGRDGAPATTSFRIIG